MSHPFPQTPGAPAPAASSTGPLGSDAAVLGAPISVRFCTSVRAQFIRPMACIECGDQFVPRALPPGLPRCGRRECA